MTARVERLIPGVKKSHLPSAMWVKAGQMQLLRCFTYGTTSRDIIILMGNVETIGQLHYCIILIGNLENCSVVVQLHILG